MSLGPLFDAAAARARRDEALARVDAHAPADWKARAQAVLVDVARRQPELIATDLWKAGLDAPHEPRALGAVLQRAVREGILAPTGRVAQTDRTKAHARPCAVWRSLLYVPPRTRCSPVECERETGHAEVPGFGYCRCTSRMFA